MGRSELGQDLAIEANVTLLQGTHEHRVTCSKCAGSGGDADLHQATIVALLEFAVAVGVPTSFDRSDLRESNAVLATPHHALGTGQNILAAFDAVGSALYTWHIREKEEGRRLNVRDHCFDVAGVGWVDLEVTTLADRCA